MASVAAGVWQAVSRSPVTAGHERDLTHERDPADAIKRKCGGGRLSGIIPLPLNTTTSVLVREWQRLGQGLGRMGVEVAVGRGRGTWGLWKLEEAGSRLPVEGPACSRLGSRPVGLGLLAPGPADHALCGFRPSGVWWPVSTAAEPNRQDAPCPQRAVPLPSRPASHSSAGWSRAPGSRPGVRLGSRGLSLAWPTASAS